MKAKTASLTITSPFRYWTVVLRHWPTHQRITHEVLARDARHAINAARNRIREDLTIDAKTYINTEYFVIQIRSTIG